MLEVDINFDQYLAILETELNIFNKTFIKNFNNQLVKKKYYYNKIVRKILTSFNLKDQNWKIEDKDPNQGKSKGFIIFLIKILTVYVKENYQNFGNINLE